MWFILNIERVYRVIIHTTQWHTHYESTQIIEGKEFPIDTETSKVHLKSFEDNSIVIDMSKVPK